MAKLRLINSNTVTIEAKALKALTIAGGSLAGGMPGKNKIIPAQPRTSAGVISWNVPAQKGASYLLVVAVPPLAGTPASGHRVKRTLTQPVNGGSRNLPPAALNPRVTKLSSKFPNGHYRLVEMIDLV